MVNLSLRNTAWRLLTNCTLILAASVLLPGPAYAQRGAGGTASVPVPAAQKWAVIIGAGGYEDQGLTPLPNAVNDAKGVYAALTGAPDGFPARNTVLMVDDAAEPLHRPTRSNILAILGQWVSLAGPEDSLLVYFAGHGLELGGKLALMPLDGRTADVENTCIPFAMFESKLESCAAKRSLVILDACHSGAGRSGSGMTPGMMADIEKHSEGRITLASCKQDEVSHEYEAGHGAFTWFLLQGLGGGADANGDGVVSALELSNYTFEETRRWAAGKALKQTPRLISDISGDIVLAKVTVVRPPEPARPPAVTQPAQSPQVTVTTGQPKPGDVQTVDLGGGVTLELVWIPPGTFTMGSPESEAGRDNDETQHQVTLSKGFWLGKYEVTQGQWERVMGSNPSTFEGDPRLPVETVSWEDCQEFLDKLNGRVSGGGFRLPTEAQWEYACRAGTATPFHFGQTISTEQANYDGNYTYGNGREGVYRERTVVVGSFPSNAWGLHDMHGNIWEWCSDWYDSDFYAKSPARDPENTAKSGARVLRGGSWYSNPWYCRSAIRDRVNPSNRDSTWGFRVVRVPSA
ncbi:MAG: SUMF1/EgtB/PvdO family nonheme iron enzyme [Candidatus Hydrogenedentes bacterium]|nr:SUMF1/EgtB/PvdO family nonheme iron enzyme [Candidatus Hydrogenedentota bacterium]